MLGMQSMMKAFGIDPAFLDAIANIKIEDVKTFAEDLMKRFVGLEKKAEAWSEDRLIEIEARLDRLEEHTALDVEGGMTQRLIASQPSEEEAAANANSRIAAMNAATGNTPEQA